MRIDDLRKTFGLIQVDTFFSMYLTYADKGNIDNLAQEFRLSIMKAINDAVKSFFSDNANRIFKHQPELLNEIVSYYGVVEDKGDVSSLHTHFCIYIQGIIDSKKYLRANLRNMTIEDARERLEKYILKSWEGNKLRPRYHNEESVKAITDKDNLINYILKSNDIDRFYGLWNDKKIKNKIKDLKEESMNNALINNFKEVYKIGKDSNIVRYTRKIDDKINSCKRKYEVYDTASNESIFKTPCNHKLCPSCADTYRNDLVNKYSYMNSSTCYLIKINVRSYGYEIDKKIKDINKKAKVVVKGMFENINSYISYRNVYIDYDNEKFIPCINLLISVDNNKTYETSSLENRVLSLLTTNDLFKEKSIDVKAERKENVVIRDEIYDLMKGQEHNMSFPYSKKLITHWDGLSFIRITSSKNKDNKNEYKENKDDKNKEVTTNKYGIRLAEEYQPLAA